MNESTFHRASYSIPRFFLSSFLFMMSIPHLFLFIILLLHPHRLTHPKCHIYDNHGSLRKLICHDICMTGLYILYINLITRVKRFNLTVSPMSLSLTAIRKKFKISFFDRALLKKIYIYFLIYVFQRRKM